MKRKLFVFVLLLLNLTISLQAQESFDVVPLTHPDGNFQANAINDTTEVAGILVKPDSSFHALMWKPDSEFVDLAEPEGFNSAAWALNDSGQVVGTISAVGSSINLAVIWKNDSYTELQLPQGVQNSNVLGLNNSGEVAGWYTDINSQTHAAYWDANGERHDLPSLGGNFEFATGINESGQIVGSSTNSEGETHAVIWQTGTLEITDLGTLNGWYTEPRDINASGQIVGYARNDQDGSFHAFVLQGDSLVELETLGGVNSTAWGINDSGIIVGSSAPAAMGIVSNQPKQWKYFHSPFANSSLNKIVEEGHEATTWKKGETTSSYEASNLNELLSIKNIHLVDAVALNSNIDIIAVTDSGQYTRLTPGKPKLRLTAEYDESMSFVGNYVEVIITITNDGTATAYETEFYSDVTNLEEYVGAIPAGEERTFTKKIMLTNSGTQRFNFYLDYFDIDLQYYFETLTKNISVDKNSLAALVHSGWRDALIADIYVDNVPVVDDLGNYSSSGKVTIEVKSTTPLVELVDGNAENNDSPLASFHLDLLSPDSTFSKKNRITFVETEEDTIKMIVQKNASFIARDPFKVDIILFHAAPASPELDITVSGKSEKVLPLTYSDYISLEPTVQTLKIGNDTQNVKAKYLQDIKAQYFQVDLSGMAGQVIDMAIVPDTSGTDTGNLQVIANDTSGNSLTVETVTGIESHSQVPHQFALHQNYPNPFNPITSIIYAIPKTEKVSIKVFDVLGKEVATLVNEEKPAGTYDITWNASNLSSGVYFYRLKAGSFIETKKMTILK